MHRIEVFVRSLAHALGLLMVLVVGFANMSIVTLTVLTAFAVHVWYSIRAR